MNRNLKIASLSVALILSAAIFSLGKATSNSGAPGAKAAASPFSTQLVRIFDGRMTPAVYSALKGDLDRRYAGNGLAPGTVEFHLLQHSGDPAVSLMGTEVGSRWHDYWPATPRYDLPYHYPQTFGFNPQRVHVGYGELFAKRALSGANALSDGAGAYKVEVTFSPAFQAEMNALLDSQPNYSGLDWFGEAKVAGTPQTEMTAVMVADSLAYLPFSVTSVLQPGNFGNSVLVASGLEQAEADLLVQRLGF